MTAPLRNAHLAVDGGGSRCRFALVSDAGRVDVLGGAANVFTDFDGAVATLRAGLALLAKRAGLDIAAFADAPAFIGLAGVLDEADAARVAEALPLANAHVADDREAAMRGALGERDGAFAALGTGSFFGRRVDGGQRFCGGWGPRLGDGASAFWIGREALARTLDAVDALTLHSRLTKALSAHFGDAPRRILLFARDAAPGEIAALAPMVTEAAAAGDAVGGSVMSDGARLICRTLRGLGWEPGEPVCLIGGASSAYRAFLPAEIAAALVSPRGAAIDGAIALARKRLK